MRDRKVLTDLHRPILCDAMNGKVDLKALQLNWYTLFAPFKVDKQLADELFWDVVTCYQEDGRYYHDLYHIQNVLQAVTSLKDKADNFVAIQLAAWFHDVVYVVQAIDNEKRSAEYAVHALKKLNLPDHIIFAVKHLILATETHQAEPHDIDCQILLDADLATFASDDEKYRLYANAIRQEFSFLPDPDYRHGRIAILKRFLQRKRIFLTTEMFTRLEQRARQNIERELEQLA